jgi:uncharacterized protein YbcI
MSEPSEPQSQARAGGQLASAISNLIVRVTLDYTGRGPTKSRTYVLDDLITVVTADLLTKGEMSLAASGQAEHVLETRRRFQIAMEGELVAGVERLTGRRVVAFMSANHLDPDIAIESFVLEPAAA